MRIYAESNFVLEMVLAQEQHEACNEFLRLAGRGEVELVLPAFSVFEPYTTLKRREKERHKLSEQLDQELKQLQRTRAFAKDVSASSLPALLVESTQEAKNQFNAAREVLLRVVRLLPLTAEVLQAAVAVEVSLELGFPDAIVLASVLEDLAARPSPAWFLNRNTADFDDPGVREALADRDCRVIGSFDQGLQFVRSRLP